MLDRLTPRVLAASGAVSGLLTVALGAFGAHALQSILAEGQREWWQTAVQYQGLHSVALLLIGWQLAHRPSRHLARAGAAFLLGIALFSGSLYTLAVTGASWLGMITPIGGICLLAGWLLTFLAAVRD